MSKQSRADKGKPAPEGARDAVLRRILAVSSLTLAITISAVSPSFAADTVVQTVTAGTRTANIAALNFTNMAYSHSAQTQMGSMSLTADDSSGSGAGWNVTILSSALVYSGANGGADIGAANLSLTSAAAPVMTAGQAVDATNGPKVPSVSPLGTLDTARKTVQAEAAYGQGTYTQALGVSLSIPARSRAGTYTATLTTTIAAAP